VQRRALALSLVALAAIGCNAEDPEHVRLPEITTFTGVGVELTGGGVLEVNIGTAVDTTAAASAIDAPPSAALGSLLTPEGVELFVSVGRFNPARFNFVANLTGTFHSGTRLLDIGSCGALASCPGGYRFIGTIDGDRVAGQLIGPLKDGGFVAVRATPFDVDVLCGGIEDPIGSEGTLNLLREGDALSGFAILYDEVLRPLTGSVDGSTVSLVQVDDEQTTLTGAFIGANVTGTYTIGELEGHWHVGPCH
jgi:hypothetical protein